MRIFTLKGGTKRKIKSDEGAILEAEFKKAVITELDISQM